MPRINNIRIAGVNYNKDLKTIQDLTLSFPDDSCVINLANGGGKSVLTLMIMQLANPLQRVKDRTLYAYFHNQKKPGYLLVEWELDGKPGEPKEYFLTGLIVAKNPRALPSDHVGKIPNIKEQNRALSLIYFCHKYTAKHPFDIHNFACLHRQPDERPTILDSYDTAERLLHEEARNNPSFWVFAKDNRNRYLEKCREYKIPSEAWAEFLSKINENENGFNSMFQHVTGTGKNAISMSISSDELIDDFFLDAVEMRIREDMDKKGDGKEDDLVHNFYEIAETAYDEREVSRQVDLYGRFLDQADITESAMNDMDASFGTFMDLKYELGVRSAALAHQKSKLEKELDRTERLKEEAAQERERIELEECSDRYYRAKDAKEEAEAALSEAQAEREKAEAELEERKAEHEKAENYFEHFLPYRKAKEEEASNRRSLDALNNPEEREALDTLKGKLKFCLEESLKEAEGLLRETEDKIRGTENNIADNKARIEEITAKNSRLQTESGELAGKTAVHQAQELRLLAPEPAFSRDERHEIRDGKAQKHKEDLAKKTEAAKQLCLEKAEAITECESEQDRLRNELDEAAAKLSELKISQHDQETKLTNVIKHREELLHALTPLDITLEAALANKNDMIGNLNAREKSLSAEIWDDRLRSNELKELAVALGDGSYYIPTSVRIWLRNEKIDYISGVDFLKEQKTELQDRYVAGFPLLPYGIVITRKDLKALDNMKLPEMASYVPVFVQDDLYPKENAENDFPVVLTEHDQIFLRHYDPELIRNTTDRIREIEKKAEELNAKVKSNQTTVDQIENAVRILSDYPYPADETDRLEDKLQNLKEQIGKEEERMKTMKTREEALRTEKKQLETEKAGAEKASAAYSEKLRDFETWLSKEPEYGEHCRRLDAIREAEEHLEKERREAESDSSNLTGNLAALKAQLSSTQTEVTELNSNLEPLESLTPVHAEADENVSALKDMIRVLVGNEKEERNRLNGMLLDAQREKNRHQDALENRGYQTSDFAGYVCTQADKFRMEQEMSQSQDLLEDTKTEEETAKKKADAAEKEENRAEGALNGKDPIAREAISGNFGYRKEAAKMQIDECKARIRADKEQLSVYDTAARHCASFADLCDTANLPKEKLADLPENVIEDTKEKCEKHRIASNEFDEKKQEFLQSYQSLCDLAKKDESLHAKAQISNVAFLAGKGYPLATELRSFTKMYRNNRDVVKTHREAKNDSLASFHERKARVFERIFDHSIAILEGIKQLFSCATLTTDGRKRRLIRCRDLEDYKDVNEQAKGAIFRHLDYALDKAVKCMEENKDTSAISAMIGSFLSSGQLLRTYTGKEQIRVEVYKFEDNAKNNRFVSWEESNSGGENNTSAFIMVITKLLYVTDTREAQQHGLLPWNVLWLDNPFGSCTSPHLVEPIYQLAAEHHIQMLMVTALTEASLYKYNKACIFLRMNASVNDANSRVILGDEEAEQYERIRNEWNSRSADDVPGQTTMESFMMFEREVS